MFPDRLGKRAENDSLVCKRLPESGGHRHRVEDGIHRHPGKGGPLVQRDAELVEGLLQLGVYLLRPVAVLLRGSIIYYVLKINLRDVKMRPCRHLHLLPAPECVKPELQQPFRLLLLGGNEPYYVLVEPFRNEFLLDISDKTMLILLTGYLLQYVFFRPFVHSHILSELAKIAIFDGYAENHKETAPNISFTFIMISNYSSDNF